MKDTVEIEGMTCASCAITVKKSLQNDGLKDVDVDYVSGEASYSAVPDVGVLETAFRNVGKLGYHVKVRKNENAEAGHVQDTGEESPVYRRFWISLLFTLPVVLHMFLYVPLLQNPWYQFLLSMPVMVIGWRHFGRSAWMSLKLKAPNMDVLIALGSSSAFIYSIAGMMLYSGHAHDYLFFETADTIITLVLLGNVLESRSVKQTTGALRELAALQPDEATLVLDTPEGESLRKIPSRDLVPGQVCLVNAGEKVPADGTVTWGEAEADESMITGESLPVEKARLSSLTGGTSIVSGSVRFRVERVGQEAYIAQTIRLVKDARRSKPEIQKTGDRISSIFVPVVTGIAVLTFLLAHFAFSVPASRSLLQAIAVLVISCPCAMGLATPTAVMVGLGRAARHGILVRGGATIEELARIRTLVVDKTGTLTTGRFSLGNVNVAEGSRESALAILYSLEKYSSHPLAVSIVQALPEMERKAIAWKNVSEDKGIGINAWDEEDNIYSAGSFRMVQHMLPPDAARHAIYVLKNNRLLASVDVTDEIKPGTVEAMNTIRRMGIRTVMVSGDNRMACEAVAAQCGIEEVHAEQLPSQKLALIESFSGKAPTAMAGDGINDAPALARASVGISLSDATQVAIQSAQVVLVPGHDLHQLVQAMQVSRHTLATIRQNLTWALAYNVVAIPVAAFGWLSPMIAAFSMAFSDVVVIGNSLRLRTKKIF